MNKLNFSLKYIIVIALIIQEGTSLQCFTCSSPFGGLCDYIPDDNQPEIQKCPYSFPMCYQLVHNVGAVKGQSAFVERGCIEGKTCKTTPPQQLVNRFCYMRNLNLCSNITLYHNNLYVFNSDDNGNESNIKPSIVILVTIFLMYVLEF